MSHLNNVAFAFGRVSQVLHVVVRSAGGVAAMAIGWALYRKRYSLPQVLAMLGATAGAFLIAVAERIVHSTTSDKGCCGAPAAQGDAAPATAPAPPDAKASATWAQAPAAGEAVLVLVLVLAAFLTHLQSATRKRYPSSSSADALFWTHAMGLVILVVLGADAVPAAVRGGEEGMAAKAVRWAGSRPLGVFLGDATPIAADGWAWLGPAAALPHMWVLALANGLTQVLCVNGVYAMLGAGADPVMITLVMTGRKALTWGISVATFGHPTITLHYVAAAVVFAGVLVYGLLPGPGPDAGAEATGPADAAVAAGAGAGSEADRAAEGSAAAASSEAAARSWLASWRASLAHAVSWDDPFLSCALTLGFVMVSEAFLSGPAEGRVAVARSVAMMAASWVACRAALLVAAGAIGAAGGQAPLAGGGKAPGAAGAIADVLRWAADLMLPPVLRPPSLAVTTALLRAAAPAAARVLLSLAHGLTGERPALTGAIAASVAALWLAPWLVAGVGFSALLAYCTHGLWRDSVGVVLAEAAAEAASWRA